MNCTQKISAPINLPSASRCGLIRLFFVAAFVTLGCGEAMGQEASPIAPATFPALTIPAENADVSTASSKLELVIWFMGNKPGTPVGSEQNSATKVGKKTFINSGMKPNRTLIKSFLKKAVNYDNTLV